MLARVVVENGVKKLVPLTADCGSGNPVGTVIAVYSNKVPNGYLPCNGVAFDTAQFPVLYALLQDDHTPDLRECTLKGIGESGRTVGAHVKAGGLAVGEFIDDRVQNHKHSGVDWDSSGQVTSFSTGTQPLSGSGNMSTGRFGATTEVKAVGVNWCIKATSGINENQADNVLNILQPVDTVAVDNLHSVTSNAVATECNKFISSQTAIKTFATQQGETWTATENCWITGYIRYDPLLGYNNPSLEIEGILVCTAYSQSGGFMLCGCCVPVKKGQQVKTKVLSSYSGTDTIISLKAYKMI